MKAILRSMMLMLCFAVFIPAQARADGGVCPRPKEGVRLGLVKSRVRESGLPLVYLNQIGGQDEIVFDGASLVCNANGTLAHALPAWEEKLVITDWDRVRRAAGSVRRVRSRKKKTVRRRSIMRWCWACAIM
ncbi:MAG: hypothetical protein WDM89_17455 [Rhizomicrobium sp.]